MSKRRRFKIAPGAMTVTATGFTADICPILAHAAFGRLCLGCAMEMAHEEADWTREQCATIAETLGVTGALVAKQIRAARPAEYNIPNRRPVTG